MLLHMLLHLTFKHTPVMTTFAVISKSVLVFQFVFVSALMCSKVFGAFSALPMEITMFSFDVASDSILRFSPDFAALH